jgi:hypothetical protein
MPSSAVQMSAGGRRPSLKLMATVVAVVLAILVVLAIRPAGAQPRALACPDPHGYLPYVALPSKVGLAHGGTSCSLSMAWTLKLINRAGSSLQQASATSTGPLDVWLSGTSCAGAYVRSFWYMKIGGSGYSHTSAENSSCV